MADHRRQPGGARHALHRHPAWARQVTSSCTDKGTRREKASRPGLAFSEGGDEPHNFGPTSRTSGGQSGANFLKLSMNRAASCRYLSM